MKSYPHCLLVGIGSIGGIIAGKMILANYDCTLLTNNEIITKSLLTNGITINEPESKNSLVVKVINVYTNSSSINDQFNFIFYMMKASHVESAINQTKHLLKPNGTVVAFQNGIVEPLFKRHFPYRVIFASVVFNSIMLEPGLYSLSKSEKIIVGRIINLTEDPVLDNIKQILSNVTPCEISNNILGVVWSKLAINCSINAITAISGKTLGDVLKKRYGKELFISIYKESIDIADKLGINLEKIKLDPYVLYSCEKTSFYKKCIQLVLIKQIAKSYSSIYPSMLQDIKKGKKTEIDYLNGYISRLGKDLDIKTPTNDEMVSLIKKIELNYLKPNISLLQIANNVPTILKQNIPEIQIT